MNSIKLFDVEFDDKYDDVIVFTTKQAQSSYFSSRFVAEFEHDDLSVIKELSNVRVYGNYNKLQTVNYAYFENEIDGVTRGYYAFVTSVDWAGIDVVSINLKIDVFQTYMFEHKLAPSYVRRAHVHQYTEAGDIVRKYLLTPENVDYGDEYVSSDPQYVENVEYSSADTISANYLKNFKVAWAIAVGVERIKDSANAEVPSGGQIGYDDNLYYVCTPVLIASNDFNLNHSATIGVRIKNEGEQKFYNCLTLQDFMSSLAKSTQVIAIYLCRSFPIPLQVYCHPRSGGGIHLYYIDITIPLRNGEKYGTIKEYNTLYGVYVPNFRANDLTLIKSVNLDVMDKTLDIKAQTFPYKYYSITNDRGSELIVKPQYLAGSIQEVGGNAVYKFDLNVEVTVSIGIYAKQGVYVNGYLGSTSKLRQYVNSTIGQLPQKTDAYLNFLQTQKASFDAGMNATITNGIYDYATGVVGTLVHYASNPVGAVHSAINTVKGVITTAQQIEMQQARVQDIKNTPDSIKKPGTDIKFEFVSDFWGVYVTTYQIPPEAMQRVSDYFTLYGYTINDFIKDFDTFLDTRKAYNYVQTTACRVTGKLNVQHIQTLEAIYNHGVRLWHYDPNNWTGFNFNKDNGDYYGTSRTPQTIQ